MTDLAAAFDPRTTLARPDLASLALEGLVRAGAYRATRSMHCRIPVGDLHADASADAERIDQLLTGEAFDVLETRGDWAWGQARRVGTVGWIAARALAPGEPLATHRVVATDAVLPLNALVHHGYSGVAMGDLSPVGDFDTDPVAVAERLLGTPHALGARSSFRTDCSGMVQQALFACGLACPRHSADQADLGRPVDRDEARRGDIVVWLDVSPDHSWTGHSAFMLNQGRVIHATGHHGAVVIEAFVEADARYLADGFEPAVFRRIG